MPEHAPPLDKTRLGFVITEAARARWARALEDKRVHLGRRFRRSGVYVADMDAQKKKGETEVHSFEFTREITVPGDYMLFLSQLRAATVVSFGSAVFMNKGEGRADYLGSARRLTERVLHVFLLDTAACAAGVRARSTSERRAQDSLAHVGARVLQDASVLAQAVGIITD